MTCHKNTPEPMTAELCILNKYVFSNVSSEGFFRLTLVKLTMQLVHLDALLACKNRVIRSLPICRREFSLVLSSYLLPLPLLPQEVHCIEYIAFCCVNM